jgi:hypothetical protein
MLLDLVFVVKNFLEASELARGDEVRFCALIVSSCENEDGTAVVVLLVGVWALVGSAVNPFELVDFGEFCLFDWRLFQLLGEANLERYTDFDGLAL